MVWNGYSGSQVYATHWNTKRTVPYCAPHYSKGAFLSWRRASLSWSGHDVLFIPQRMPCSLPMTSSICCPLTNWLMPCRLPLQPPIKNTCCITLFSSAVTSMAREQTPEGVYRICFVFIMSVLNYFSVLLSVSK